jgi:hypothetical protein
MNSKFMPAKFYKVKKSTFLNVMVGDIQRVKLSHKVGFLMHQRVPKKVWAAFETLVSAGYDQYLMKQKV